MQAESCLTPLPWETRNLGVESFAVAEHFLGAPDASSLESSLREVRMAHAGFFVQARFRPDSRTSALLEAQQFYFVETALAPTATLARCAALARFQASPGSVLPARFSLDELSIGLVAVSDPSRAAAVRAMADESFRDDRFHHDHQCPADLANRRYRLWIDDLLADATVVVRVLELRGEPVAFMASRAGHLLLAGFSRRYAGAGLGEYFWMRTLADLQTDGVTRVRTVVSVNNLPVLNLYVRLGFKLGDARSTFHRWER